MNNRDRFKTAEEGHVERLIRARAKSMCRHDSRSRSRVRAPSSERPPLPFHVLGPNRPTLKFTGLPTRTACQRPYSPRPHFEGKIKNFFFFSGVIFGSRKTFILFCIICYLSLWPEFTIWIANCLLKKYIWKT
jgi:hypothetical protein